MEQTMNTGTKTLHMTHVFKAAREKVWAAWTGPEQFKQWWSPDTFTIPVCELDVRVDGAMNVTMQGPDGTLYPSAGTFTKVQEPECLSFTTTPLDADGQPLFEVLQELVFTEQDGQTRLELTVTVLSETPAAAPFLAGMQAGMAQSWQKLVVWLEK